MDLRVVHACSRAVRYVLSRQCASGGFCFYRSDYLEEPNLADTYHAVTALGLLGHAVPREADVAAFLDGFPPSAQPAHLYYRVGTRRALEPAFRPAEGLARSIQDLRLTTPPSTIRLSGWLARTRLCVRLKRELADVAGEDAMLPDGSTIRRWLRRVITREGGFGARPNLHDTWLALEILEACEALDGWLQTAAFIDRLQAKPFGFTETLVGITANIDVIFAGVRCCGLLGIPVRYPERALRFVLQCQTGNGGFARAPDALPGLDYTCAAIGALLSLGKASTGGAAVTGPGVATQR
jgi:hypothetical protein